jgi:hypothetical protein
MNTRGGGGDFAAEAEVTGHFWAAQIEVAIFEAQFLVNFARDFRVVDGERKDVGGVEDFQGSDCDFNFAGGDFGISGAGRALTHFAGDAMTHSLRKAAALSKSSLERSEGSKTVWVRPSRSRTSMKMRPPRVAPGMDPAG